MQPAWGRDSAALLGRVFISGIFLQAVLGKTLGWSGQAAYMAANGMHFITPLLAAALVIEAVGTACILSGRALGEIASPEGICCANPLSRR